jgi:flagellar basal body-associated protein FliL
MSEKSDRSIGTSRMLIALVLLAVLVVAAAAGYLWLRSGQGAGPAAEQQPPPTAAADRPDAPLSVVLFLPVESALVQTAAGIRRQPELQLEVRAAAEAVLASERASQAPVLRDLRLRALYLDAAGTAFVDLAPGKEMRGGVWDELLAVYALVNTLTQNFPEVKQVRFLLDGREAPTLAGHLDLSRAFVKRTDLVKAQ